MAFLADRCEAVRIDSFSNFFECVAGGHRNTQPLWLTFGLTRARRRVYFDRIDRIAALLDAIFDRTEAMLSLKLLSAGRIQNSYL